MTSRAYAVALSAFVFSLASATFAQVRPTAVTVPETDFKVFFDPEAEGVGGGVVEPPVSVGDGTYRVYTVYPNATLRLHAIDANGSVLWSQSEPAWTFTALPELMRWGGRLKTLPDGTAYLVAATQDQVYRYTASGVNTWGASVSAPITSIAPDPNDGGVVIRSAEFGNVDVRKFSGTQAWGTPPKWHHRFPGGAQFPALFGPDNHFYTIDRFISDFSTELPRFIQFNGITGARECDPLTPAWPDRFVIDSAAAYWSYFETLYTAGASCVPTVKYESGRQWLDVWGLSDDIVLASEGDYGTAANPTPTPPNLVGVPRDEGTVWRNADVNIENARFTSSSPWAVVGDRLFVLANSSLNPNGVDLVEMALATGEIIRRRSLVGYCHAVGVCGIRAGGDQQLFITGNGPVYRIVTTPPARILLNPSAVSFSAGSGGTTPEANTVSLGNSGGTALNFTTAVSHDWCHVNPASGFVTPGAFVSLTVSVDAPSNVGTFACSVSISDASADNSPQALTVSYTVTSSPVSRMRLSPRALTFESESGRQPPTPKTVTLENTGGLTLNYSLRTTHDWCHVDPVAGSLGPNNSHALSVRVDGPSNVGIFSCEVLVSDPWAKNSPQKILVTYRVSPPLPSIELATAFAKRQKLKTAFFVSEETLVWQSFTRQLRTLVDNEQGALDPCTLNTLNATREIAQKLYLKGAIEELTSSILAASHAFPGTSPLASILTGTGAHLVARTLVTESAPTPLVVVKAVMQSTLGYILGKALSKALADPSASVLTDKYIRKLLRESGASYAEGAGVSLQTSTQANVAVAYSPDTRFVVGVIGSDCNADSYALRYEVDAHARRTGKLTVLVISPAGRHVRTDYSLAGS